MLHFKVRRILYSSNTVQVQNKTLLNSLIAVVAVHLCPVGQCAGRVEGSYCVRRRLGTE